MNFVDKERYSNLRFLEKLKIKQSFLVCLGTFRSSVTSTKGIKPTLDALTSWKTAKRGILLILNIALNIFLDSRILDFVRRSFQRRRAAIFKGSPAIRRSFFLFSLGGNYPAFLRKKTPDPRLKGVKAKGICRISAPKTFQSKKLKL